MINFTYPNSYSKNIIKLFGNISNNLWNDWNWQLKNSIKTYKDLTNIIPQLKNKISEDVFEKYHFSITPYFFCLIDFDNIEADPIANQVIPSNFELKHDNFLSIDPFSEKIKTPAKNLIQRYPDRILLLTTNLCASYCRYCTRKWNWNTNQTLKKEDITYTKEFLEKNPQIREVIISGGDPLLLDFDFLEEIIFNLINVKTIEVIRIASRVPSFLPQRITDDLANILKKYKTIWLITHFNHPNEITPKTEEAIDKLIYSGVSLANQTVLLKNINDDLKTMKKLLYSLEALRIKPYYLFNCDLVEGTAHFRTSIDSGLQLLKELWNNIGGLCIPNYVVDLPELGKIPILPQYILSEDENCIVFKNSFGKTFSYPKK
ncbi:MAG: hypothetical protein A2086_04080 [Spirochaetes bacterium GWD1_27_9]|nr:MAG: hypothetical protein A2Z98_09160 [Spirochaetes bacterium GWB1_27_13]OHD24791.1 MAG: hypothetical protein A2Y34_05880 [Spirochaetes bacterium GWC1_27_15]OHD45200.1 MAG: hypothetical protein A2086_04080 [Spirochaetes bacterium GWD1_27_9]